MSMSDDLIARAAAARENAVAPYSQFKVGCAIEAVDGRVFTGCNIENATYGLSVCAERVALWKALSEGAREFTQLAMITAADSPTPPCGACRQLLWEYCGNLRIVTQTLGGAVRQFHLVELLPNPFDRSQLPVTNL
jgi:cytidine deaminase